jgi:hypothetical protein
MLLLQLPFEEAHVLLLLLLTSAARFHQVLTRAG